MKRALLITVAIGALLLAACAPEVTVENTGSGESQAGGIAVSGTGEVFGTPDTLRISFGVSVLRPTVEAAVSDAANLADGLISTLETLGVSEEDIRTANYSIYPEYDYSGEQRRLEGYRVNNTVIATIRDVESAGPIIDAAVANVGDEIVVSGVSFAIEDDDELVTAARAAAWEDARTKAQQLADLAGVSLGTAVSIAETIESASPVPVYRDFLEEAGADAATPIEPGQQQVAVTIQVRFDIDG